MAHRGFDKDSSNDDILKFQLEAAAKDRNSDITGEKVDIVHMHPEKFEDAKDLPDYSKIWHRTIVQTERSILGLRTLACHEAGT